MECIFIDFSNPYLTAYQEIVAIDIEKEAKEVLAFSREIIQLPSIKTKQISDQVVELLGFKPDFTMLNIPQPYVNVEMVELPKTTVQELRKLPGVEELREMMWWLRPGPHVYPDLRSALLDCE
ncbi:hypothetical protein CHS0354_038454 [Potamilus streckersoni]|uniref:Uncharacterized protein n=1 Tax=Potamilus streckersoni TaxID=2493646 RepID=A0AAE0VQW8_9BIVA|nr:hypothetical protein CHS0354_038454 [Potamilus streckersoni]